MPKFVKPVSIVKNPSPELVKTLNGFTYEDLWWPVKDSYLKQIRLAIKDPLTYAKLFTKDFPDLRPYLLYLLSKGQIEKETFELLHMLAQIKTVYPEIIVEKLSNNIDMLDLSDARTKKFLQQLPEKEDVIFKINVPRQIPQLQLRQRLYKLKEIIINKNDRSALDYLEENKHFFDKFRDGILESTLAQIKKALGQKKLVREQHDFILEKLDKRLDILENIRILRNIEHVIFKKPSPLFDYHYSSIEGWFFIWLPHKALELYLEIKTRQLPFMQMNWHYGLITPLQMNNAKKQNIRLGSIVPYEFEVDENIHGERIANHFETTLHDLYHYVVVSHIPAAVHLIVNHWIELLQTETQYSLSRHIWDLIDSEYLKGLDYKSILDKEQIILKSSIIRLFKDEKHNDTLLTSHEWYLMMVDMFINRNEKLWENIIVYDLIKDLLHNKEIIKCIKDVCKEPGSSTLSEIAAKVYLRLNHINIHVTNITWKKDHKPVSNALSLYMNDVSLRDLVSQHQENKDQGTHALAINRSFITPPDSTPPNSEKGPKIAPTYNKI